MVTNLVSHTVKEFTNDCEFYKAVVKMGMYPNKAAQALWKAKHVCLSPESYQLNVATVAS